VDAFHGGVDHAVGLAAGLDFLHALGDEIGVGSEVLQKLDAVVEAEDGHLPRFARDESVQQRGDFPDSGKNRVGVRVGLHGHHQRDRNVGDIDADVLGLGVVVEPKIARLEAVDVGATIVRDSDGNQHDVHCLLNHRDVRLLSEQRNRHAGKEPFRDRHVCMGDAGHPHPVSASLSPK
jgi:hypothetical protein